MISSVKQELSRWQRTWRSDVLSSLVVFLVALPLCLGIAIAAGVPPEMGLISGVVGGLIVGFISGAPLQVSGPAAGLTVICYQANQQFGLEGLAMITIIDGVLQVLMGLARLGQWFRAVSPAVIEGMLAGIGVLILASQFHVMVDDSPKSNGLANLISIPQSIWKGLLPGDSPSHYWAARLGVLTILILVTWKAVAPKQLKLIPAPLVAVVLATAAATFGGMEVKHLQVSGILHAMHLPGASALEKLLDPALLGAGIVMALIASAETMLCAAALDKMNHDPQLRVRFDRELCAQGLGNLTCGLIGGLPITGVMVRTAANIEGGARSRLSTILHGVWLLALASSMPGLLQLIPTAALAAVLVHTGYKLMNLPGLKKLWQAGWWEVAVWAATLSTIVAKDLLTGVIVGIVLSIVRLVYLFSYLQVQIVRRSGDHMVQLRLRGAATFLRLPRIAAALEKIEPNVDLHIDLEQLTFIDHACFDLLMHWQQQHEATGGKLTMDWGKLTAKFRHAHKPSLGQAA